MRKILLSILAIFLVIGFLGTGAFAWFSDTETSTGNTFTAGTLDLKIKDDDPDTWDDGASATWVLTKIVPGANNDGVDKVTNFVYLRRYGSITPNHLEIQASVSLDENVNQVESDTNENSTANEMAAKFQITSMLYDGVALLDRLNDADGDGIKTLNDMTYDPDGTPSNGLDDLPIPVSTSGGTPFMMTIKWIEGSDDNDFQGDTLTASITFTLNQDSSQ